MHAVFFRNMPVFEKFDSKTGIGYLYLNNVHGALPFAVISPRGNVIMNGAQIGTCNQLRSR